MRNSGFVQESATFRTLLRKRPDRETWFSAMITGDGEVLLGAIRNYLGKVKTPYDKRTLVTRLEAFISRPETQRSMVELLDGLDIALLGTSAISGPLPEDDLKGFFLGELPLFELGIRIANLNDRLLLFRYSEGGRRLVALNPLVEKVILPVVLDPARCLGERSGGQSPDGASESAPSGAPEGAPETALSWPASVSAVGLYCFLYHSGNWIRKDGGMSKKGVEKFGVVMPGFDPVRAESCIRAFVDGGILRSPGDKDDTSTLDSFESLVAEWREDIPFYLAVCLEGGGTGTRLEYRQRARCLSSAFRSARVGAGFLFSRTALTRWISVAFYRAGLRIDSRRLVDSLENLGVLEVAGPGLRWNRPPTTRPDPARHVLVTEGSHALHLLPEASLEDRLYIGMCARPVSFGKVWSFEIDRTSLRRALSRGLGIEDIRGRLESLSGRPLTQSLVFSLESWQEDYRSLRAYRGTVLVADERLRPILEHELTLNPFIAEKLAPGVYFLKDIPSEEFGRALARAGVEIPAITDAPPYGEAAGISLAREGRDRWVTPDQSVSGVAFGINAYAMEPADADGADAERPEPRLEIRLASLRASLSASGGDWTDAEKREIADRIERRLILSEAQIGQLDARMERQEAGGLDYSGKVRVVEKALRSPGDRLEILYRPPGGEAQCLMTRPVRLEKSEKGMVLEAEDLAAGGPVRINLGAVSTVRRVRASLFGEDT